MKINEWLKRLGSHTIYDLESIKADYKKATGNSADWKGTDPAWINKTYGTLKRVVKPLKEDGKPVISAFTIAKKLYSKYGNGKAKENYLGGGSQFREYISNIEV